MKSIIHKILVVCLMCALGTNVAAQENPVQIQALLLNYLTGYCDEGEANTFVGFIQKNAKTVAPLLVNYVQTGVPETLIDRVKKNSARQFSERQKLLNQELNFGLNRADLDSVINESQEGMTNRLLREFRNGFQSQAILGLSLIDSEETQSLIKKIAAEEGNPYQRFAQNAVDQIYIKRRE